MPHATMPSWRALPAYLGAKRRLVRLIFAMLAEVLPPPWNQTSLIDPFCGGCSVAIWAKALGLHVIASDIAERAAITARALIANSHVKIAFEDVLALFDVRKNGHDRADDHPLYRTFPPWQAEVFIHALASAGAYDEPKRSLLRLLITKVFLRCVPMSLARVADARRAAADDFDGLTARRTDHYLRSRELVTPQRLWTVAQDVNGGVFGGFGQAFKADALNILASTSVDVAYLDPPYAGTAVYRREYRLLDEVLGDDVSGPDRVPTLDELLIAADRIPIVMLSYGGPRMTAETLATIVERHRRVRRVLSIAHPHLNPLTKEDRRATNQEFLVIATK